MHQREVKVGGRFFVSSSHWWQESDEAVVSDDAPEETGTSTAVRRTTQDTRRVTQTSSTVKRPPKAGKKKGPAVARTVPPKPAAAVVAASAAPAIPAVAAQPLGDLAANLRPAYDRLRANNQCTCHLLKPEQVGPLRILARAVRIETFFIDGDKRKLVAKPMLLLSMCGTCQTLEDVAAVGGGEREGIAAKFWAPVIVALLLSVLDALHLSFRHAAVNFADGPAAVHVRMELNRFRAHLLSHALTNGRRYLFQGKINMVGEQGNVVTQSRRLREMTFGTAMLSTLQHYNDDHNVLYCGKLRKGQACVPFQTWSDCGDAVRPIVERQIHLLITFVIRRGENDRVVKLEEPFAGSQNELRAHFQLPLLE
jgi:hypothetical protein